MAQYVVPGRFAKLEVSKDGGANYIPVKGIKQIVLNESTDDQDTSDMDDDGAKAFQPGLSEATFSIDLNYLDNDQGQMILVSTADDKYKALYRFYMEKGLAGNGKRMWTGQFYSNANSQTAANADPASSSITLRASGHRRTQQ